MRRVGIDRTRSAVVAVTSSSGADSRLRQGVDAGEVESRGGVALTVRRGRNAIVAGLSGVSHGQRLLADPTEGSVPTAAAPTLLEARVDAVPHRPGDSHPGRRS